MPNRADYDKLYIDIAVRIAKMSKARRKKVGAIIVKDHCIVSYGWNGTASGEDNCCENPKIGIDFSLNPDGVLKDRFKPNDHITKDSVIHAEMNALLKMVGSSGDATGATMYITISPCLICSRFIYQSKAIKEVVYGKMYKDLDGANWLKKKRILVRERSDDKLQFIQ